MISQISTVANSITVGIYFYSNGDKYEGDWMVNPSGKGSSVLIVGTMYYANGDRYKGDWKNNVKEGEGILSL